MSAEAPTAHLPAVHIIKDALIAVGALCAINAIGFTVWALLVVRAERRNTAAALAA